jgi:hypothetical protein
MHELNEAQIELGPSAGRQLQDACEHLVRELIEGIRHGFFEMTVAVEIGPSKKRRITVKAGKSYQFLVAEEEVPRK